MAVFLILVNMMIRIVTTLALQNLENVSDTSSLNPYSSVK